MSFSLVGRVVLVTGAGRGNGEAIAIGMAAAGARVVVTDMDEPAAEAVAVRIRANHGVACTSLAEKVEQTIGEISCVVNNAGVLLRTSIDDVDGPNVLAETLAVNVHGPFNVTRAFLPALRRARGSVINVTSIQSFVAAPYSSAYASSKGAVAPGLIETAMTSNARKDVERMQAFFAHTPMRRLGLPSELAGSVIFLASAAASYITGAVLPVDGGYLAA